MFFFWEKNEIGGFLETNEMVLQCTRTSVLNVQAASGLALWQCGGFIEHVHTFSWACVHFEHVHAFSWASTSARSQLSLCTDTWACTHFQLSMCTLSFEHLYTYTWACACFQLSMCTTTLEHMHACIGIGGISLNICMLPVEHVHIFSWAWARFQPSIVSSVKI